MPGSSDGEPQRVVGARQPLGVAGHLDRLAHRRRRPGPASVTVSASGVRSTGSRSLGVGDPERGPHLAAGGQHRAARRRTARARGRPSRRGGRRRRRPSRRRRTPPSRTAPAAAPLPSRNRRRRRRSSAGRAGHRQRTYPPPMVDRGQLPTLQLEVDGHQVEVADDGASLLDVLRSTLGLRSPKDGCSPQGQCGCCTVLVDGQPRVACVTPARRVAGRSITTLDGLAARRAGPLGRRLLRHRREPVRVLHARDHLPARGRCGPRAPSAADHDAVEQALLAHLCRCTGWRTILDAWDVATGSAPPSPPATSTAAARARRDRGRRPAGGGTRGRARPRRVRRRHRAAGRARRRARRRRAAGRSARRSPRPGPAAGKVQGRRTTVEARPRSTSRTATGRPRCARRGSSRPTSSRTRRGASPAASRHAARQRRRLRRQARRARHRAPPARWPTSTGAPVRVLLDREDVVRLGPKRPPVAGGADADGRGRAAGGAHAGHRGAIASVAPLLVVEEVDVAGPPTSAELRAAGWAEATVLLAGARGATGTGHRSRHAARWPRRRSAPTARPRPRRRRRGARRGRPPLLRHRRRPHGAVLGQLRGDRRRRGRRRPRPHDPVVRRAARRRHAADRGRGGPGRRPGPARGSDAVFVAVAAAAWLHLGCPVDWPTGARWR